METVLGDIENIGYVIRRYGISNNQTTTVSKRFGVHKMFDSIKAVYDLESEGIYGKYYFCVFGYQGIESPERVGFDCYYINIEDESNAEAHTFFIWNARIYQIEQYMNYLIYVNADKDYSLTAHDFKSDRKKILKKKYGTTEKSSFSYRLWLGKSTFQKPEKYMILGKWLWVETPDKLTPQIISIE